MGKVHGRIGRPTSGPARPGAFGSVPGDAITVRYADDLVVGFQYKRHAERFLSAAKARFQSFELDLHPDKTRLIEFGRFAQAHHQQRGLGRPETFDLLGFTHYCSETRQGWFTMGHKPVAKRMARTLKQINEMLHRRMHDDVEDTAKWLELVVDRWLNYYAGPTSSRSIVRFVRHLKRIWLRSLRRRSQKDRFPWVGISRLTARHWPSVTIRHPWPSQRYAVRV